MEVLLCTLTLYLSISASVVLDQAWCWGVLIYYLKCSAQDAENGGGRKRHQVCARSQQKFKITQLHTTNVFDSQMRVLN